MSNHNCKAVYYMCDVGFDCKAGSMCCRSCKIKCRYSCAEYKLHPEGCGTQTKRQVECKSSKT